MKSLCYTWACMTCDAKGSGPDSAKQAEKHTKDATHPCQVSGVLCDG